MDETEDELIKRVARAMFGGDVEFTPQILEMIQELFRKYQDDIDRERAA